jgi:hypothetical protein
MAGIFFADISRPLYTRRAKLQVYSALIQPGDADPQIADYGTTDAGSHSPALPVSARGAPLRASRLDYRVRSGSAAWAQEKVTLRLELIPNGYHD